MEHINRALSEANAFGRENQPHCAYYKYLKAVHLSGDLLRDTALFGTDSAPRNIVENLFEICGNCLDRADQTLGYVLDFADEQANKASESGILGFSTHMIGKDDGLQIRCRTPDLATPAPYKQVNVTEKKPEPAIANEKVESDYGPEPELGLREDADLPLIPASNIHIAHCQQVYDIQLIVQKLEQFTTASPKQRSNALYLTNLRQLLERLKKLVMVKLDLEEGLALCYDMRIRDIPPADLARQITLLQMTLLKRVTIEELKIGSSPSKAFLIPNLFNFLALSKYLGHWCQYEVLRYSRDIDRASVLGHLIKMAIMLRDMANFDGVKSIVNGLTARPIHRLRRTHALLPRRLRNELESLALLISERRGYAQLRDALRKRTSPLILPLMAVLEDGMHRSDYLIKWSQCLQSSYFELFASQAVIQNYILTQPFRWEEELHAISLLREPPSVKGKDEEGLAELPSNEMSQMGFGEGELYEQVRRRIEDADRYVANPVFPPSNSPSIR